VTRAEILEHLKELEEQTQALWTEANVTEEDGCTKGEALAIEKARQALQEAVRAVDEGVDQVFSSVPIDVPLGLPYKKARMRNVRQFQLVYCSSLIARFGSVNEAAKFAKLEKSNFRRILRTAQTDLTK